MRKSLVGQFSADAFVNFQHVGWHPPQALPRWFIDNCDEIISLGRNCVRQERERGEREMREREMRERDERERGEREERERGSLSGKHQDMKN